MRADRVETWLGAQPDLELRTGRKSNGLRQDPIDRAHRPWLRRPKMADTFDALRLRRTG